MTNRITIDVSKDGVTGRLQVSINEVDEKGGGHGYRLAGPKFNGTSTQLIEAELDQRDADEIRGYLDKTFPAKAADGDEPAFPTVTICGSMRFFPRMIEVAAQLTSLGQIVLMPFDASLTGIPDKTATEHGAMLDEMHRAKIRLSGSVYVVNTGGYVGESTRNEIEYAATLGIPVEYDEAVAKPAPAVCGFELDDGSVAHYGVGGAE